MLLRAASAEKAVARSGRSDYTISVVRLTCKYTVACGSKIATWCYPTILACVLHVSRKTDQRDNLSAKTSSIKLATTVALQCFVSSTALLWSRPQYAALHSTSTTAELPSQSIPQQDPPLLYLVNSPHASRFPWLKHLPRLDSCKCFWRRWQLAQILWPTINRASDVFNT